jgi:hypothetical protein
MDDNEYEIHPLDRDYSSPPPVTRRNSQILYHVQLRRFGLVGLATGFATVVLAGILLTSFRGAGTIESIGSVLHRFGMILILIGGVVFIVAYRVPHMQGKLRLPDGSFRWSLRQSYLALLFWNIVGFCAVTIAIYLSPSISSPEVYVFFVNGTMTIACALMVTVVVWHRGFIRAYAVGSLVALVFNGFSALFMLGRYWQFNGPSLLLVSLATILISGLVCGGYVCLLESAIESRKSNQAQS